MGFFLQAIGGFITPWALFHMAWSTLSGDRDRGPARPDRHHGGGPDHHADLQTAARPGDPRS
ncbi:MAG: hypothetical protein MZV64_70800 [Ignavibacteriales bacterium]|nr:hypothetical protein [Ignavibacteriales bacterium]